MCRTFWVSVVFTFKNHPVNYFRPGSIKNIITSEEKIKILKELKIISPKANEIKELYYKGAYTKDSVKCDVVGIVDNNEIILNINVK